MVEAKCINKFMGNDNKSIVEYRLMDANGVTIDIEPKQLKRAIKQQQINVINLKLTSDNKLRSTDNLDNVVYINRELITTIGNLKKALYFKSNVNMNNIKSKALALGKSITQLSENIYLIDNEASIGILSDKQICLCRDAHNMFSHTAYTSIDLSEIDTSNSINMEAMFDSCKSTSINVSKFDTSRVTNMKSMFSNTKNLKELDLRSFNTSKLKSLNYMFDLCCADRIDISSFDTSNVKSMICTFKDCRANIIGLNNLDVRNVNNMTATFRYFKAKKLDISNWNFENASDLGHMLSNCMSDIIDLSNIRLDESKVYYTDSMFHCTRSKVITTNRVILEALKDN